MSVLLFDLPPEQARLKPFTFLRPISHLRIGILTMAEKWEKYLGQKTYPLCVAYLQQKYPPVSEKINLFINATVLPDPQVATRVLALQKGQALWKEDILIAFSGEDLTETYPFFPLNDFNKIEYPQPLDILGGVTDLFSKNGQEIRKDFELLTKGRESEAIEDKHTLVYGRGNVFIEEGAQLKAAILNGEKGVIYIGKNATIQEGTIIQGNFAICEGATTSLGAKLRGDTSIGPYCKVGGEVSNSLFQGYSNKAHEGFIGNSVIGEWCNLGADTNNSNMKNNYSSIKIWDYASRDYQDTGRRFCGLMLGDHSKTGINTMFNTGTVTGIFTNIYGEGFPPKFIPSFSWGGSAGFITYELEKALETAEIMMERRNIEMTEEDRKIIQYLFNQKENW